MSQEAELYLGGGEDQALDQLWLCEHLNLLYDPRAPVQQGHFVDPSGL